VAIDPGLITVSKKIRYGVLQQDAVLQGLMPALNLALRLRVAEGAVNIFDAVVSSNRASSASVFSPLTADSATFALPSP
jgi:hypothetical protein